MAKATLAPIGSGEKPKLRVDLSFIRIGRSHSLIALATLPMPDHHPNFDYLLLSTSTELICAHPHYSGSIQKQTREVQSVCLFASIDIISSIRANLVTPKL